MAICGKKSCRARYGFLGLSRKALVECCPECGWDPQRDPWEDDDPKEPEYNDPKTDTGFSGRGCPSGRIYNP